MIMLCHHPFCSVHVAFATKVFELLANASNHSELRQVLAMFRCFLAANSSLFEVFSHLKISLLAALSHIFTVSIIIVS